MAAEVPAELSSSPQMTEHVAFSRPGVRVLVAGIVLILVGGTLLGLGAGPWPGRRGPEDADRARPSWCSSRPT